MCITVPQISQFGLGLTLDMLRCDLVIVYTIDTLFKSLLSASVGWSKANQMHVHATAAAAVSGRPS